MRHTKIICTIGPASDSVSMLVSMIKSGMDIARLNFSHGDHAYHEKLITAVRAASKKAGKEISIIQDLQGPRIRLGKFTGSILLEEGLTVTLLPQKDFVKSKKITVPLDYASLGREVSVGQHILIADGAFDLEIKKIEGLFIICKVIAGGQVTAHKGINVPGAILKAASLSAKDKKDIAFGLSHDVDFIAVSFVKTAKDMLETRKVIEKQIKKRKSLPGLIAKIELPLAVANFDEIAEVSDAIMVARGDLGIEMPIAQLPLVQKKLITRSRELGKPVIVATQMMESMINNRRPTRAEASDVANAVLDGADAVMLSGESANGKYPQETVSMMTEIVTATESADIDEEELCCESPKTSSEGIAQAIAHISHGQDIAAVVIERAEPGMVTMIARYCPDASIMAFSNDSRIRSRLHLLQGVTSFISVKNPQSFLKRKGLLQVGDSILYLSGENLKLQYLC